jgi:16S rRNA (adenine1518-N6/adenine1519-N6)-dimethyltransferase
MIVPAKAFFPKPQVESAVITLDVLPEPSVSVNNEKFFFRTVKAAFAQRRKTIRNNLVASFGSILSTEEIDFVLTKACIAPVRRGETLSLKEFAGLSDIIEASMNKTANN